MTDMNEIDLNEYFLDDNYSIESLLSKTRESNLTIKELLERLTQHQLNLNQTSSKLFDSSYDRFYKLSYGISCLAEPIQHLIQPFDSFRNQLKQLCIDHSVYIQEIDKKLASLEDTSKNKIDSKILIGLIQRMNRIEQQMGRIDWSIGPVDKSKGNYASDVKHPHTMDYMTKCDLIERIYVEIHIMKKSIRDIEPKHDELLSIKKALEENIEQNRVQLEAWFEKSLVSATELNDQSFRQFIYRTYTQLV